MATVKKARVERVEVTEGKHLQILIRKETIVDGEVTAFENHRTVVSPGGNVANQMALVNAHLAQMGFDAPDQADVDQIQADADREHTQAVIDAYVAATQR